MFIYGLKDPISNKIRYVGRTNDLDRRFKEHLRVDRTASCHKKNWIASLITNGLKPELVVLKVVKDGEDPEYLEDLYLSMFKDLTNTPWRGGSTGSKAGSERLELRKPVIARSVKTGEELQFDSIYSVPEPFKGNQISSCLRGASIQHQGYYWRFADEVFVDPSLNRVRSQGYGVIRTSASGEEKYYLKVTDAMSEGFSSSGIQRCAAGAYEQHKGYSWRFATVDDKIKFTGNSVKEAFQRNKKRSA